MKFFISSTYVDLIEYRDCAINYFKNITNDKTGSIGAMEFFVASERTCKEECLKELSSSDVVIGIYGLRYGSKDSETGLSMTEVEFDYAVQHNKPILAFVVRGAAEPKQARFIKEKVFATNKSCARYASLQEFADRLDDSIKDYLNGLEGFSYSSLWGEIRQLRQDIDTDIKNGSLHMEIFEEGNDESAVKEICRCSENLLSFMPSLMEMYCKVLASDNGAESREEMLKCAELFFIGLPNNMRKIRLAAYFLQLNILQNRLLTEVWTDDLRNLTLEARNAYIKIAENSYHID